MKTKEQYTIKTLVASITRILTVFTDASIAKEILKKLKDQVNDSLNTISMFRNIHENDRHFIHCHCLAIAFYLDHYEGESKHHLEYYEQKIQLSHIFAHLMQTHEFKSQTHLMQTHENKSLTNLKLPSEKHKNVIENC